MQPINTVTTSIHRTKQTLQGEYIQSLTGVGMADEPEIRLWNAPGTNTTGEVPPITEVDEQITPEQLVRAGMDEAEREHRLAASAAQNTAS